jgi:hypothetical protein
MLRWKTEAGNWYGAYWGSNLLTGTNYGTDGTSTRRYMGPLPATGQWVRLDVPATAVDLGDQNLTGMKFILYDGEVAWDKAGKTQLSVSDSDGDGLPDWWEFGYFSNLVAQAGTGDADNDGWINLQEYENGYHPFPATGTVRASGWHLHFHGRRTGESGRRTLSMAFKRHQRGFRDKPEPYDHECAPEPPWRGLRSGPFQCGRHANLHELSCDSDRDRDQLRRAQHECGGVVAGRV